MILQKQSFLPALSPGETGRVQALHTKGSMRRRLLDLGLIPGTRIVCIGQSPAGDPTAYYIRGAVIALRSADAATIELQSETGR